MRAASARPAPSSGDYFGIDSDGTSIYTTSVSTYDGGANPSHYQQQWVAKVAIP
jgi:hypothetical protein